MRTTLTLEPDVAARLEQERRARRVPFKVVVNDALRAGLAAMPSRRRRRARFQTEGFDLGSSLIGSLDNIEEVLSRAEGEAHR